MGSGGQRRRARRSPDLNALPRKIPEETPKPPERTGTELLFAKALRARWGKKLKRVPEEDGDL